VRPDSIGDAVLASAMLEPLRARFPKASVVVVCQEHIAAFYRHCPLVDDVITFQRQSFIDDAGYRQSVVRALRDFDADLAVCSVFSRDQIGEMLTVECGARFIVGCDGDGANLPVAEAARGASRYDMNVPANGQWGSELDRHSDLLSALDPSYDRRTSPLVPRVWTSAEDAESASEILVDLGWSSEDTLVLFAGAQYAIRHYPGYAQALRSTCREQGLKVIALGVLGERELNQQVLDQLDVPVRNLCGSLSMGETVEVIRRARVAIGAETGYAHIACAVGTPNVVVLGGGHFGRFMPWSPLTRVACLPLSCYACNWHCRFSQAHCIQDLPAGVVQVALRAALGPACAHPQFYLAADSSWSPGPASPGWAWPSGLLAPGLVEGFFVGRDGAIEQMDARSAPGGLVSLVSVP
jgi:ADP-heptose:LPS heptosyltransferase